jgi:hypothetical protein
VIPRWCSLCKGRLRVVMVQIENVRGPGIVSAYQQRRWVCWKCNVVIRVQRAPRRESVVREKR